MLMQSIMPLEMVLTLILYDAVHAKHFHFANQQTRTPWQAQNHIICNNSTLVQPWNLPLPLDRNLAGIWIKGKIIHPRNTPRPE